MTTFKANRKFPNPATVTDDPKSHTLALQQIIEALNVGQRRTKEVMSSYVRVHELVDAGLIEVVGNQLKLTNAGAAVVSASGVQSIVAGTNISVDDTDPANPIVSATGGAGSLSGCVVRRTTAQTIATGTPTAVSFDSELFDDGGYYDAGSPTRLTAPADGWYSIVGWIHWAGSNGLGRRTIIRLDGTTTIGRESTTAASDHNDPACTASINYYLTAGQYVELIADQNQGGNVDTTANAVYFSMAALGSVGPAGPTGPSATQRRVLGAAWGSTAALVAASCADVVVHVPQDGTIVVAKVYTQGGSGSCAVDVWKDTYANFPPTDAVTITASAPPTVSAGTKSEDTTLTGWTTAVSRGDVLVFHVDSTSTFTNIVVILEVEYS